MNDYTVYKHTFPNQKVYIGITQTKPSKRWKNGKGYQSQFVYNAIQKYGWDNIKHEVLFSGLTQEEAEQKERELIVQYQSANRNHGYNISLGGNHQGRVSEETKQKLKNRIISEETKEKLRQANLGKKQSKETIEKRIRSLKGGNSGSFKKGQIPHNKGVSMSEEQKEKLRQANLGKKAWNKGLKMSSEVKQKLSKIHSKENLSSETLKKMSNSQNLRFKTMGVSKETRLKLSLIGRKTVIQFSLEGKELNRFNSMIEAESKTNVKRQCISGCCRGVHRSAGGFKWAYA